MTTYVYLQAPHLPQETWYQLSQASEKPFLSNLLQLLHIIKLKLAIAWHSTLTPCPVALLSLTSSQRQAHPLSLLPFACRSATFGALLLLCTLGGGSGAIANRHFYSSEPRSPQIIQVGATCRQIQ